MRIKIFVIIILLLGVQFKGLTSPWESAIHAYESGAYLEAIDQFESIDEYTNNEAVMYNLGNAYYQIGKIGKAIWCYEKTIQLSPTHQDAWHNIAIARAKIVNPYEDVNASLSIIQRIAFSVPTVVWVIITMLTAGIGGYLLFNKKQIIAAVLSIMLSIGVVYFAIESIHPQEGGRYGIIMTTQEQYYQDAQLEQAIERNIPEGTKVKIIKHGDVLNIELPNGVQGYINAANVAII